MRLPPRLPQLGDAPIDMARVLYKASTGSVKSTEYLRDALGWCVVAWLGGDVWEDASVGEWVASLAERLGPQPDCVATLRMAIEDELVPRASSLDAEPALDEHDARKSFQVGSLEDFLHGERAPDETAVLVAALRRLEQGWEPGQLVDDAATWAWPPSLDLDRPRVGAGLLVCVALMRRVDLVEARRRLVAYLEERYWDESDGAEERARDLEEVEAGIDALS